MPGDPRIQVNSVVQIDPERDEEGILKTDRQFGGAFLIVTEVKSWGVQGYVHAFGPTREEGAGQAYYRVSYKNLVYIGEAEWIVGPSPEENHETETK